MIVIDAIPQIKEQALGHPRMLAGEPENRVVTARSFCPPTLLAHYGTLSPTAPATVFDGYLI